MHRAFRILIHTYPRTFRTRWRDDLVAFHDEAVRAARTRGGVLWRTRFWARTVADVAEAGLRLRMRQARIRGRPRPMGTIWTEWRSAWRGLRRAPGFHLLSALTLGLGVAATTAVFGVLDGVVLRPLPYPASDRLVRVASRMVMNPGDPGPMSHRDIVMLAERSRALASIAAVETRTRVIQADGEPELAPAVAASEGFLEMLGARPALGRLFAGADHAAGAPDQVVLGHETWRTRYGGADVVGRTIRVDARPHVIVGVLERGFLAPEAVNAGAAEYWTNLRLDATEKGSYGSSVIGLLRPGGTAAAAEVEVTGLMQEWYREDGGPPFVSGGIVTGLQEATVGRIASHHAALRAILGDSAAP